MPEAGGEVVTPEEMRLYRRPSPEDEDLKTHAPDHQGDDCPFEGPGGCRPCLIGRGCIYLEGCPLTDPLQEDDL